MEENRKSPRTKRAEERYYQNLEIAKNTDFSQLDATGVLRIQGADKENRPCIIVDGSKFPNLAEQKLPLETLYLYFIRSVDEIVEGEYVFIYLHSSGAPNRPSTAQLSRWYAAVPYKYSKNVKSFFVVNGNFWTSLFVNFFVPIVSIKFWWKFLSVPGIVELNGYMSTPVEITEELEPAVEDVGEVDIEADEQHL